MYMFQKDFQKKNPNVPQLHCNTYPKCLTYLLTRRVDDCIKNTLQASNQLLWI